MNRTINIELYADERDFIVDLLGYALLDDLLNNLKQAKHNRENIITICVDEYNLEQLIGNLSLEANHNKKRLIQELAGELAEKLEFYEFQLKRADT